MHTHTLWKDRENGERCGKRRTDYEMRMKRLNEKRRKKYVFDDSLN